MAQGIRVGIIGAGWPGRKHAQGYRGAGGVQIAGEVKKLAAAAAKSGKVLLYAAQRRFGGAEQAAVQALAKGYAGDVYHARASWMRTRGVTSGTGGWFTDKSRSGGGAMIDLG